MIYVNSVSVYPSYVTLSPGEWYYGAYAEVCPTYATCSCVTWSSSNTNVATVNPTTGYIYARSAGTARIYASATDGSGYQDYCTVNVTSSSICVSSVCLNRTSLSLQNGNSDTLTATVCPPNATNKSLTWNSSNTSVATVSNGTVHANATGGTWITATAQDGSGESDSCYVTVTGNTLVNSVTVCPSSKTMYVGDWAYLYETVCPTNATNKCVTWSSSNPSAVTVNPDSGFIYAQNAGTATIYATANNGSGKRGSCAITVTAPISVTVITVCPSNLTMNVGETEYLCSTVYPVNATNQSVISLILKDEKDVSWKQYLKFAGGAIIGVILSFISVPPSFVNTVLFAVLGAMLSEMLVLFFLTVKRAYKKDTIISYYHTAYLTGRNDIGERIRAYNDLQSDSAELEILFTVDILNEGVDIPGVNMVLFLRPTESSTIFIQQLGRGLRKYENKQFVTVR